MQHLIIEVYKSLNKFKTFNYIDTESKVDNLCQSIDLKIKIEINKMADEREIIVDSVRAHGTTIKEIKGNFHWN